MKVTMHWLVEVENKPQAFNLIQRRLVAHFETMSSLEVVGLRTRALVSKFREFNAGPEFIVQPNHLTGIKSSSRVPAGHRVDSVLKTSSDEFVAIELAFNNREAIGSNFMKVAIALEHRCEHVENRLAVLIAPSRVLLEYGAWDRSYGEATEYLKAFELGYGNHLQCNTLILELGV